MTPPVEPTAAEREPNRVQDARYHELATGETVEWRYRNWLRSWQPCAREGFAPYFWQPVPHYSRDGNAMLAVIAEMATKGWNVEINVYSEPGNSRVSAQFWKPGIVPEYRFGAEAPEAVVEAAIHAFGWEEPADDDEDAALEGEAGR